MKPRVFHLIRDEDHTGVSGTGIVAEGIVFSTGRVALHWTASGLSSTALHDSLENLVAIHGHSGRTRVVFLDELDALYAVEPVAVTARA
jgi:hypothetical protein